MKAMILAAGRGERMGTLTDFTPKPLLSLAGKALIEYSLESLSQAGFKEIVINVAYRGQQIIDYCGDGRRWQVSIQYSDEGSVALETAGGIARALPLLGEQPFLVVNADIIFDYPLSRLRCQSVDLAHLVLIKNPPHHPIGDFYLNPQAKVSEQGSDKLTFSGIGVYHPDLFKAVDPNQPLKLRPVLNQAMQQGKVSGEFFTGLWQDIGTPQRLQEIAETFCQPV